MLHPLQLSGLGPVGGSGWSGWSGPSVGGLSLVDLVVALVVVAAVLGALRRRAGLLGSLGSGLGALLVAWLVLVAVAAWAPAPLARAAETSRVLHVVPAPDRALAEAGRLLDRLTGDPSPAPSAPRTALTSLTNERGIR